MKFTIAVHGAPYASHSNHHALEFCRACIAADHQIERVFFYHEGVSVALGSQVPPQEESDPTQAWQLLAQNHNFELAVCVANALKRGVINASEANRYDIDAATLADGFVLVGLGQLIHAIAVTDRYVEFPA